MFRSKFKCRLGSLIKINQSVIHGQEKPLSLVLKRYLDKRPILAYIRLGQGGVSMAAQSNVTERCLKRHGRWKSEIAKDGYIVDSLDSRLQVTRELQL
ncbi:hypothetical protein SNE40_008393 [Patella caerulea]|uniref:Uncharacterized protein n=1 Tax=Patella caerulea TaxID=87958 RepID=A0AAN8Q3N2_PATCE